MCSAFSRNSRMISKHWPLISIPSFRPCVSHCIVIAMRLVCCATNLWFVSKVSLSSKNDFSRSDDADSDSAEEEEEESLVGEIGGKKIKLSREIAINCVPRASQQKLWRSGEWGRGGGWVEEGVGGGGGGGYGA